MSYQSDDQIQRTYSQPHTTQRNPVIDHTGLNIDEEFTPRSTISYTPLNGHQKLSYGVGHVLNDLTASFWFSYLLIYLRNVLEFTGSYAGLLMLIGQISDGLATPGVGYISDKSNKLRIDHILHNNNNNNIMDKDSVVTDVGFGRKTWILWGSIVLAITFPFVFHSIPAWMSLNDSDDIIRVLYYSVFITTLQFAWACVQVNHLALVTELTPIHHERVYLNSLRSCFTILCNIAVYIMAYIAINTDATAPGVNSLTPADESTFFKLSLMIVLIGMSFVTIFLCGVAEPRSHTEHPHKTQMIWYQWFTRSQFYIVAVIYMCTRVLVNVVQVYTPIYLLQTLNAPKSSISTIPLLIFAVGFTSTLLSERSTKQLGSTGLTLVGCCSILIACCTIYFDIKFSYITYITAVCIGISSGVIGVSALGIICELVDTNVQSSAFIYGCMSFVDKLANGAAIYATERLTPDCATCHKHTLPTFYRRVMIYIPGCTALLCIGMLVVLRSITRKKRAYSILYNNDHTQHINALNQYPIAEHHA